MKALLKKIENCVVDSVESLESVKIKERYDKKLKKRNNTDLVLAMTFDKEKLSWVNISYQKEFNFQFSISLLRSLDNFFYISINLSSNFYNLDEKEQKKNIHYFLRCYPELVSMVSNDKNAEKKLELIKKKSQIEAELKKL